MTLGFSWEQREVEEGLATCEVGMYEVICTALDLLAKIIAIHSSHLMSMRSADNPTISGGSTFYVSYI